MDTLPLDAPRNTYSDRIGQRGYDAFDTVAYRPQTSHRFTPRAANDGALVSPASAGDFSAIPAWFVIVAGGLVAAIVGAMLGGALHI
jgi:hypothetical protein